MTLIRKVLIANRGEIACRVLRTCRAMGIATVAVFSDADANGLHVREADEAVRIGASAANASYLNIPALIAAARRTDADAIHPGYGFLSENAAFAAACRDAGITFIGPTPEVIARMGSKREAKLLMAAAGVPVVPGYEGQDQSDTQFIAAAREIGYPVLVKASAGGGGKGMHAAERAADLPDALATARREALAAFGDETLIMEKLIVEPRHVEFQIFGDAHGHLIHLGERECSIQRRHQKIIEETPSTALTPDLRARIGEAAVTVGRQLSYTNAGTVEFILDADGNFYFLEVNTRLQVEHPVTELVTGLDLVRWQLLIAEGHPLPLTQDQISFTGHAIEARIYAEDPANGFLPSTGAIALWRQPSGEGIRVDSGIQIGDAITPYYDPMLAKISAYGADREEALRRLARALNTTTLFGVHNNLSFLARIALHPAHIAGEISSAFITRHAAALFASPQSLPDSLSSSATAVLLVALQRHLTVPTRNTMSAVDHVSLGFPLASAEAGTRGEAPRGLGGEASWRNNRYQPLIECFTVPTSETSTSRLVSDTSIEVRLTPRARNQFAAVIVYENTSMTVDLTVHEHNGCDLTVELDGRLVRATICEDGGQRWWVQVGATTRVIRWLSPLPDREPRPYTSSAQAATTSDARRSHAPLRSDGAVLAPMPGQVVAVLVELGQAVAASDALIILEAMKMEHTVRAPHAGVVAALHANAGEQIAVGATLLELRSQTEEGP